MLIKTITYDLKYYTCYGVQLIRRNVRIIPSQFFLDRKVYNSCGNVQNKSQLRIFSINIHNNFKPLGHFDSSSSLTVVYTLYHLLKKNSLHGNKHILYIAINLRTMPTIVASNNVCWLNISS